MLVTVFYEIMMDESVIGMCARFDAGEVIVLFSIDIVNVIVENVYVGRRLDMNAAITEPVRPSGDFKAANNPIIGSDPVYGFNFTYSPKASGPLEKYAPANSGFPPSAPGKNRNLNIILLEKTEMSAAIRPSTCINPREKDYAISTLR